jgi:hypothetical protein
MDDEESLIKDGEIREYSGYWYAIYEFQSPLSEDQIKVAKRAILYRFMEFLENCKENEIYHKIIIHKDFRQIPDFLGRNKLYSPSVALVIETDKRK